MKIWLNITTVYVLLQLTAGYVEGLSVNCTENKTGLLYNCKLH